MSLIPLVLLLSSAVSGYRYRAGPPGECRAIGGGADNRARSGISR